MTALLKRGLSLTVVILVLGLVSCTTTGPTVTLTGPAGPYVIGEGTVTLTATGNPGSAAGLWTYSFSATPACGTFSPTTIGPTNQTTVTTVFTPTTDIHNCALTVTLTTASGRMVTASITRSVGVRPTVVSTVPSNSSSNVPVATSSISVTFSHDMDPASLVLTCTGEADGPGHEPSSWYSCNMTIGAPTGGPKTFTWTVSDPDATPPARLQHWRAYRLQISGRRAPSFLIPMAAPYVFAFDTEPLLAGIVINKIAINGDATFTYTSTIPGSATFDITTTGGSGSQTFADLVPGIYTVTESPPPTGWEFTSLSCVDPSGDTTVVGSTASINLAQGETVTCTYTNTFIATLPACTFGEVAGALLPPGYARRYTISGVTPGHRAFAYIQLYSADGYHDTVLHLQSALVSIYTYCPSPLPSGYLECDDEDGATYTSLGGTLIAYDYNSVIAGHPITNPFYLALVGYGAAQVDPHRIYIHLVPPGNLVEYTTDPPASPAGAPPVPATPTPWMIGQSITAGDADWYRFRVDTIPAGGLVLFVALDTSPDTPTSPHDDVSAWFGTVELRDGTGTLLRSTADNLTGFPIPYGEALAIRITTPGTYIIGVRHFDATGTGPGYHLTACTTTPTALPASVGEMTIGEPVEEDAEKEQPPPRDKERR